MENIMPKIKINIYSDIHTEMPAYYLDNTQYRQDGDLIILAGDIAHACDAVEVISRLFPGKTVAYTPGNHEYYGMGKSIDDCNAIIAKDVDAYNAQGNGHIIFLNDNMSIHDINNVPVRFIGGTLWTDFNLYGNVERDMRLVGMSLNDYRLIRSPDGAMKPKETLERHWNTRNVIKNVVSSEFDGPTIVVTHHLPSLKAIHPMYKKDRVTAGFASKMDDMFGDNVTLWVAGHTHSSSMFKSKGTLFVCNPEGYTRGGGSKENKGFNPDMEIDIRKGAPNGKWKAGK